MATETPAATAPGQDQIVEEQISQLRTLFADAPEVGKAALEKAFRELTSQASTTPAPTLGLRRMGPVAGRPPCVPRRVQEPLRCGGQLGRHET